MVIKPWVITAIFAALVELFARLAELAAQAAVVELAPLAWAGTNELPLSIRDLDSGSFVGTRAFARALAIRLVDGLLNVDGLAEELSLHGLELLLEASPLPS